MDDLINDLKIGLGFGVTNEDSDEEKLESKFTACKMSTITDEQIKAWKIFERIQEIGYDGKIEYCIDGELLIIMKSLFKEYKETLRRDGDPFCQLTTIMDLIQDLEAVKKELEEVCEYLSPESFQNILKLRERRRIHQYLFDKTHEIQP
jgi:hypothetical protein